MISLLSGTNRSGSNTRKVTAILEKIYSQLGAEYRVLDLQSLPPEIFAPAAYGEKPAAFVPMAQQILDSDGVVVVTPEYNGSFPGVLKLFIDHLKFPESFEKRPVCFVGLSAGMWGALRSVEQLQQIFGYRNAYLFPNRVFMPGIGGLLDEQGRIKDAELQGRLERQAAEFVSFAGTLRGKKLG